MYTIDFERYETIIVGRFKGNLTLTEAVSLRKQLEKTLLTSKIKDLAIDLSLVDHVDSSGIGALVGACTTARSRGKRLMLYMPTADVLATMKAAQICNFFPMLESESALKARQLKRH